jgi:hypothetical protein
LGWRNPLLYYRDLKTATLDLSGAPDAVLEGLFGGEPIRVSSLAGADAADAGTAARMIRSAAALARRVLVLDEEQGVDAGRVAVGFVRAERPGPASRTSSRASSDLFPLDAPLLLWRMQLRAAGSSPADFALRLSDDGCEPNPVLLYALEQETGQDRTALMDKLTELITTSDVAVPPMELAARCLSLLERELQETRLS